jgi:Ca2+-binding EF-hand superfamily protein
MNTVNTSDEQIRITVEEIFKQYDANNSGSLELGELLRVVKDIFSQVGERKSIT